MAATFEVKATNITVDPGTKGVLPTGADSTGRDWPCGSIVQLSDQAEIAGLVAVGAIEPVASKAPEAEAAPKAEAKPAAKDAPKQDAPKQK